MIVLTSFHFLSACVAESVDAADLKSVVLFGRAGSSPAAGTNVSDLKNLLCTIPFSIVQVETLLFCNDTHVLWL